MINFAEMCKYMIDLQLLPDVLCNIVLDYLLTSRTLKRLFDCDYGYDHAGCHSVYSLVAGKHVYIFYMHMVQNYNFFGNVSVFNKASRPPTLNTFKNCIAVYDDEIYMYSESVIHVHTIFGAHDRRKSININFSSDVTMVIANNYIYMCDRDGKHIYVFDLDGNLQSYGYKLIRPMYYSFCIVDDNIFVMTKYGVDVYSIHTLKLVSSRLAFILGDSPITYSNVLLIKNELYICDSQKMYIVNLEHGFTKIVYNVYYIVYSGEYLIVQHKSTDVYADVYKII